MRRNVKKTAAKIKKPASRKTQKMSLSRKTRSAKARIRVVRDSDSLEAEQHRADEQRVKLLAKAAKGPHGRYVQRLLNIRDRLLDDIEFHASDNLKRTQKEASSDLSAYSFHMADAGTDNFDREFALSMVSNEQELLNEVNDALKRLENGTYGVCEMCGKPIPKARLDAIPWTRYTVECQSELEKTQQKRPPQTFQLSDFGNSEEEILDKEEEV